MPTRTFRLILSGLVLALAGCDTNERPQEDPVTILDLKVTPNPVASGAPLRVEVTLEDTSQVYEYMLQHTMVQPTGDGPRYSISSRYSRFMTVAPTGPGLYQTFLLVRGRRTLLASTQITLTVRP